MFAGEGSGDGEVEIRTQRLSIAPGTRAALFVPGRPANIRLPVGSKGRTLTIERSALEAHFALLTGHASRAAIPFEPELDLTTGGGTTLHGIVRLLREELERPAASPFVRPRLFDVLLTALVTIPRHDGSHLLELPPPRIAPAIVRRAEEYIAAHAGEAIRLSDIVAAAGAPARSLQAAFRAARGVTPIGFLKLRRLEQARQMLLAPQPGTTAVRVAAAMGFRSAGRFSVEYRKHFHESPSETLARWTSGVLARLYPDHVKEKRSGDNDVSRLKRYVYPVVDDVRIDAFTLDNAEAVMRGVPAERAAVTRRHVAQILHRLCAMAIFPLRLIAASPLARGLLPKVGPGKAKGCAGAEEGGRRRGCARVRG